VLRNTEELARWDESKKWKHKNENLSQKLKEASAEVSKLAKANQTLREINGYLQPSLIFL